MNIEENEKTITKNKKYARPVYFSNEETQLIKVAALMDDVSINTYIHDSVMERMEKRMEEYVEVYKKIKGNETPK